MYQYLLERPSELENLAVRSAGDLCERACHVEKHSTFFLLLNQYAEKGQGVEHSIMLMELIAAARL